MSAVLEFKAKCEHDWTGSPSKCAACRRNNYKVMTAGNPDLRKTVKLIEGGRVCLDCEKGKPWKDFAKDEYGYNRKTANCKECRNIKNQQYIKEHPEIPAMYSSLKNRPSVLKRKYGITWEQVIRAFDAQMGFCANRACGQKISLDVKGNTKERAVIDHNHKTGKFRALLCSPCNLLLGTLETKENLILGLMEYSNKHK